MPVRLRPKGRQSIEIDESTFHYRTMPRDVLAEIQSKAIKLTQVKKGVGRMAAEVETGLATQSVEKDIFDWGLLGWDNVVDGDGEQIGFDKALVGYLPGHVLDQIQLAIIGDLADELTEEEEKNSPVT